MANGSYITWGSTGGSKNTQPTIGNKNATSKPESQGSDIKQYFEVKTDKFNDEEKEKFNALSDDKKEEIYNEVENIVQSVKLGAPLEKDKDLITDVLSTNDADEAKVFSLNFEGHISLDFPIAVTVKIDSDIYDASEPIYVYHILQDNTIESLGEVEKTIKDGKIDQITFYTTGFSNFFTHNKELNIEETNKKNEPTKTGDNKTLWIIIAVAAVALIVFSLRFVLLKNKKIKNINIEE